MRETVTPWKFSVEGEQGLEADELDGELGGGTRGGGGGEGDPAGLVVRASLGMGIPLTDLRAPPEVSPQSGQGGPAVALVRNGLMYVPR